MGRCLFLPNRPFSPNLTHICQVIPLVDFIQMAFPLFTHTLGKERTDDAGNQKSNNRKVYIFSNASTENMSLKMRLLKYCIGCLLDMVIIKLVYLTTP